MTLFHRCVIMLAILIGPAGTQLARADDTIVSNGVKINYSVKRHS